MTAVPGASTTSTPTTSTPTSVRSAPPGARTVLEPAEIPRALTRIAHEILERNKGLDDVVLLGIPTRGVDLARTPRAAHRRGRGRRASPSAASTSRCTATTCACARPERSSAPTSPPGGVDGKVVVLVDDVLFSGRTVRAALDALDDLGRPRAVQLAVLVDRGHRELPDPRRLRRQEPADLEPRGRQGAARGARRPGRRLHRRPRRRHRRRHHGESLRPDDRGGPR